MEGPEGIPRLTEYLLDTHTCVYALISPAKLGTAARRALQEVERGRAIVWIPAVVAIEIALLRERGRIGVGLPQLREALAQASGLQFLALDLQQIDEFAVLTSIKDPFDRLILSACRATGARLITKDANLLDSKIVHTVWD